MIGKNRQRGGVVDPFGRKKTDPLAGLDSLTGGDTEKSSETPSQPAAKENAGARGTADSKEATEKTAANPPLNAEELAVQIESLKRQLSEEHQQRLKALAESENVRKRTEKELANAHKYALERFAKDLLETVDNLERSLSKRAEQPELNDFYAGIELTLKSLKDTLLRYHISEVNPLAQPFDPALHNAIMSRPDENAISGTVLEVVQKGYLLHDRLLRPAMVIVAG